MKILRQAQKIIVNLANKPVRRTCSKVSKNSWRIVLGKVLGKVLKNINF